MEVIFFLLLIISFAFGILILLLLFQNYAGGGDPGTATLLAPLIPLTLITGLEIISYYLKSRFPGTSFPLVALLFEWCRIAIAFGWNYLACRHYELNGVGSGERRKIAAIAVLAGILFAAAPVIQFLFPRSLPGLNGLVILMLYHAGLKGVLITRKTKNLLPSSWAAVTVAAFSLVGYPAIAVGDVLGWKLPFIEGEFSFWVQAHPLYVLLVNIPMLIFALRFSSRPAPTPETHETLNYGEILKILSSREKEVFDLLYRGYRYEDMARQLYLSLATIKTHVHHIYRKLGISRREELYQRIRSQEKEPPREI